MIYDTHCHPFLAKEKSQNKTLKDFFSWEWKYLNSIAIDIPSSFSSLSLAKKYTWVYASIGIHPTSCQEYIWRLQRTISSLENLYFQYRSEIIAIGESGLDYHWLEKLSEKYNISKKELVENQKKFFIAQIKLAKKLWLPLIIHNRDAKDDILKILKQESFQNFIFHCYSEDIDFAEKLIKFAPNCLLWFWWIVTFKNAFSIQKTVKNVPLKNIIIETDSPYLTPTPHRGKEENEPLYSQYILDSIIDLRKEPSNMIKETIFENSLKAFKIKRR